MPSLADIFDRVAVKKLAAVDLPNRGSNQHELNGVQSLRDFFGTDETTRTAMQLHLYRDGEEAIHESTSVTFYDSRENQKHRAAEWRLYYKGDFLANAAPDDVLVLARTRDGGLHGFVFASDSGWLAAARELFNFESEQLNFELLPNSQISAASLAFARRQILAELGIDVVVPTSSDYVSVARSVLKKHDGSFPDTRTMAATAREIVRVDVEDPDRSICSWLDSEEQLFYAMENELLRDDIDIGFHSVEEFLSLAQTTLQRRKSRMGFSLQHHAAEIFTRHGLKFIAQPVTERKNRPDFIFPGKHEYDDPAFPDARLTMLAAKSTCKDRWRQILTEADRVLRKHLLTLDQALSLSQLGEMHQAHVQIVVPLPLQKSYAENAISYFMSLRSFIDHVADRER